MNLVWKLLRQHISIGQFVGFSLANMLGVLIILFGFQFYNDVLPVFTGDDSFMKNNYIIINKNIGTAKSTLPVRLLTESMTHQYVQQFGHLRNQVAEVCKWGGAVCVCQL